jgi:hypothetical protein
LILAAIATALTPTELTTHTKKLLRDELRLTQLYHHHLLRFFDYKFRTGVSVSSRRDYFVIPHAALDVVIASTNSASFVGRLVGLRRTEWILGRINPVQPGFFAATNDALFGSKDQAWTAIALAASRRLLNADKLPARVVLSIQRNDALWGYVSIFVLILAGAASLVPESILSLAGLMAAGPRPDPTWAPGAAFALRLAGTIVLAAWGQGLGGRALHLVGGWFR